MAFPAFLDTCVLYPAYLSDTLLRLAEAETYRPLWSADVLAELRRNLIEQGIDADKVDYRMGQMRQVFPSAVVTGYESLISAMTNHPKDRHVLAAAVRANAEVVVTFNTRDFGEEAPDTPSRCYTSKLPPTAENPPRWRASSCGSNSQESRDSPPISGAIFGRKRASVRPRRPTRRRRCRRRRTSGGPGAR